MTKKENRQKSQEEKMKNKYMKNFTLNSKSGTQVN